MATSTSRRITRKQLRQPDQFQIYSEQALEFFQNHRSLVFAGIGALALIVVIIAGWQLFKTRQNIAASQAFTQATELYEAEKYREALPAFAKVQQYRWSNYAGLAYLYEANSHIALGDLEKALSTAQRAVTATRPDTLYRQLALMALATAAEQKNDCRQAMAPYSEAQMIAAAQQDEALLGKARCLEKTGDKVGSLAAYKEYVKNHPGSIMSTKVAELESAAKSAPVAK